MDLKGQPLFVTTRWSVILAAQEKTSPQAAAALETLCRTYWYPLYAYVRGTGRQPSDAQDLTQEFFNRLLSQDWLQAVFPEKGRFRTFLLVAMKRFLANSYQKDRAQKRGGGQVPLPLDNLEAENRFLAEPALAPDELYERRWAMTLLDQALQRLAAEFRQVGKQREFECLKEWLAEERGKIPYPTIAAALSCSEGAARVAVHRFRKRFRELFRSAIAETVTSPEDLETELRHLVEILSRS